MPRYAGTDIVLTVNDVPYVFPPRSIDDFPDARPFLQHLIDRGHAAPATAVKYVKLGARLHRTGRLAGDHTSLHNVNDRTVAKAYRRWAIDAYTDRTAAVARALKTWLPARASVARLRRGSLVPPFEGKHIPLRRLPNAGSLSIFGPPPTAQLVPLAPVIPIVPLPEIAPIDWVATPGAWTLHVPLDAKTPVHNDPCETCVAVVLDDAQLEAVAAAFEQAYGHRDLNKVAPDAFLFGTPPPDYTGDSVREVTPTGNVLALVKPGPLADSLRQLGATVARDQHEFLAHAIERVPDTVVISREACGDSKLLGATQAAWDRVPA